MTHAIMGPMAMQPFAGLKGQLLLQSEHAMPVVTAYLLPCNFLPCTQFVLYLPLSSNTVHSVYVNTSLAQLILCHGALVTDCNDPPKVPLAYGGSWPGYSSKDGGNAGWVAAQDEHTLLVTAMYRTVGLYNTSMTTNAIVYACVLGGALL
jgi:hypothetical protein